MFNAKSPSPANGNYDFSLRHERVKLFGKVLKQFDNHITRTSQAMREVACSLSLVGHSYHEVAQCVNNTNPHSCMNTAYHISFHNRLAESYGQTLQRAGSLFSEEMKSIKEGAQYVTYNGAVHQTVLARLHEVLKHTQKTRGLGDDVESALRKLITSRKVVSKKEAKYLHKGRPLTESKLYVKQVGKMRQHEQIYEAKLRTFDAEYESLMQRQMYVAGHTMDDFLDANTTYLAQMLKVVGCLAPNGPEAVQRMVESGEQLGERLGVAPEDQLGSRLRPRPGSAVSADMSGSLGKSPGKATPAKSSRGGSAHNFTCYYDNRRNLAPSAERAPPTARGMDEEDGEAAAAQTIYKENANPNSPGGLSAGGTPHRQLLLDYRTPLHFAGGESGGNTAHTAQLAGRAFSAEEPDPSPPPQQAPSFHAAARHTDPLPLVGRPTNPFAVLAPPPAAACAPAADMGSGRLTGSSVAEQRRGAAAPRRPTAEPAARHTPFGTGATPPVAAFPSPAASATCRAADVPPSSQRADRRRSSAALGPAATAAADRADLLLALQRGRSSEPFDDYYVSLDARERTPRGSLQPLVLFPPETPEHADELRVPLHSPRPRGSTATISDIMARTRQHARRSVEGQRPSGGAAAGAMGFASAPPPPEDDNMSMSINTHWLDASDRNRGGSGVYAFGGGYGQRPAQEPAPRPTQCIPAAPAGAAPQRYTVLSNIETGFHPASVRASCRDAAGAYPWCGDGVDSDAGRYGGGGGYANGNSGGVSGRSQSLSASCGLDSPVPTPQPGLLEMRAWEDSQVRHEGLS